jgi:hypothetical protein
MSPSSLLSLYWDGPEANRSVSLALKCLATDWLLKQELSVGAVETAIYALSPLLVSHAEGWGENVESLILNVCDKRYLTATGWDYFVDLLRHRVERELPEPPEEQASCNLTRLTERWLLTQECFHKTPLFVPDQAQEA